MMKKITLSLLASCSILGSTSAQTLIAEYDFNSLTVDTALAGQDGWVNFQTSGTGPIVRSRTPTGLSPQQGGAWATDGEVTRAYRDFGDFGLTGNAFVTIEFDLIRVGSSGQALLGIGDVTTGTPATLSPFVGTFSSTGGFQIREAGESGTFYSALDSGGNVVLPVANNLYRVRSIWNLADETGTLQVMNLSAGETTFTTLYFNAAQTISAVSLGSLGDVTAWDDLVIRTGGSGSQAGLIDNVYVTAIPEPGVTALLGVFGVFAVMVMRRRQRI